MNKCTLIGNLTKDPQLRETPGGVSVCTFSIGVSRRYANHEGQRETDFFNIVVWRKQAENAAKYLRKGSQVGIAGAIQNRRYEDANGSTRYVTEIIADEVQYLKTKDNKSAKDGESPLDIMHMQDMLEINEDMPF